MATFTGTAGNDTFTGTSGGDTFNMTQGGDDTVSGLGGNDVFNFGAAFNAADTIDGGDGSDFLQLNGDYSAGVIFGATTMVNVETIQFAAGHSYNITTDDANVAAGQSLSIDAHTLGAGDSLTFNGAAEGDGRFLVQGGAGNDVVIAGGGNDVLNFSQGGNDHVFGRAGNDAINMGAAMTASDRIDGGSGFDALQLNGNYAGANALVFAPTTITNVENIQLGVGFNYDLTMDDANVTAGNVLNIDAHLLGAGNTFTFDGAAESNGFFTITGGAGNDFLIGGNAPLPPAHPGVNYDNIYDLSLGGNDIVEGGIGNDEFIMGAALNAADSLDGNGGTDLIVLNGDYSAGLTMGGATIQNMTKMQFNAGHSYSLTEANGNVAAGQTLSLDATMLGASDNFTFNGAAETDGAFIFGAGAGLNTLTGGNGTDVFNLAGTFAAVGGAGADTFSTAVLAASDSIDGGSGSDTLVAFGNITVTLNASTVTNVETLRILAGTGQTVDIVANDGTVAAGQTMVVNTTNVSNGGTDIYDGSAETDGHYSFLAGSQPATNTLIGGALSDSFTLAAAATNNVTGGGGADTVNISGGVKGLTTYTYDAVSDSTSTGYDTITGITSSNFVFHVSPIGAVTGVDATVSSGSLSTATFDSDLAAAVGAGQLAANHAVEFTATSGTLSGSTFLVVDENGTAGYQAGADLVIDLGTAHPALTLANFS